MAGLNDTFSGNAFSVLEMTATVNRMDYLPGRAGEVAFAGVGKGIPTTAAAVEEKSGSLALVQSSERGGAGQQNTTDRRKLRSVPVPHIQLDDTVLADSVQGVREFGNPNALAGVQAVVADRQAGMVSKIDMTVEHLRLGALSGLVKDADGSTLVDLFDLFGVTQEEEVDFALTTATTDVRKKCADVIRAIKRNLKMPAGSNLRVHSFCSDDFFDALIEHAKVKAAYDGYAAAERRLGASYAHGIFEFGGIYFENYQGTDDNSTVAIAANKAIFFPAGVPGVYAEWYAPADYEETVNTIGLPRYSRQYPMLNGKGRNLEVQSNPLPICLSPKALLKGKKA